MTRRRPRRWTRVAWSARGRPPRSDPRAWRAGEQPQGRQRRAAEAPADGVHRRLRLGQESLVFDTIAAESQRLINETYSAFVQGFMPTLARPEVDVLEGLTTAIIVDQQRMGADPRSTVGTATDANAMLRILFSRLGQPHIGSPRRSPSTSPRCAASGGITVERGHRKTVKASFSRTGGMCPRCEGRGTVSDIDLNQLFDDSKSLDRGRAHDSRLSDAAAGTSGSTARRASTTRTSRSATTPRKSGTTSSTSEPTRMKIDGHQHDLRGADPADPEVDALQGHGGDAAAHPGIRRPGGDVHDLSRLRRHTAQ